MAKGAAAAKVEEEISLEQLYAGFTQEELAEFFETTGQAANLQDRTPILKVNYQDIADKTGREIKKGNFVLGQNGGEVEVEVDGNKELRIEDVGIDLGKNPKITVLTYGFKYVFYPKDKDKKKNCASQLVFDRRVEKAVGNNLGHECQSKGACPRRAEGVGKDDKCSCQWVVFCLVPLEDGTQQKAIMYVKGESYMPFQDYLQSAGTIPVFFAPTKLSTTMKREGTVNYFVIGFELLKNQPYQKEVVFSHRDLAKSTREGAELYKQQQLQKPAARVQIANKGEGRSVTTISDDDVTDIEFD